MAVTLRFEIAAVTSADLAELVAREVVQRREPSDAVTSDALLGEGAVLGVGATCAVREADPTPGATAVSDLGVHPTAVVWWRLFSDHEPGPQMDHVVGVVGSLLARTAGDAVLTMNYDVVLLLRRDGELTVHDDDAYWPAECQALLPEPVQRAPLAFPD